LTSFDCSAFAHPGNDFGFAGQHFQKNLAPRRRARHRINLTAFLDELAGLFFHSVLQSSCSEAPSSRCLFPQVKVPPSVTSKTEWLPAVPPEAPDFVQSFAARIIANEGDSLPVSAFPVDGTFPTGTAQWEKRNIALEIPVWDAAICIQCNKCAMVCPSRGDPCEGLRSAVPLEGPGDVQSDGLQGRRVQAYSLS
jgi:ferredoxin